MRRLSWIPLCRITIVAFVLTRRLPVGAFRTAAVPSVSRRVSVPTTASHRYLSLESYQDDQSRWEKMYYGDDASEAIDDSSLGNKEDGTTTDGVDCYAGTASEVRVVTFDLDNCLWKTGDTIAAANDALAAFLDERNITQPVRVEQVMGEVFRESKKRYSPAGCKAPVLLTELRKDAIRRVLQDHNGYLEKEATDLAEKAFAVWTETRHATIPQHFASSVVECLKCIRETPTSSGRPILIGAVTDGNSDPRNVDVLRSFFDFCVNAETVGVAKPDKRMYVEAMKIVSRHEYVQDLFGELQLSEEAVEDIIGPWWVHVGDDFIKDVVPAKELRMRSIWARELILSKIMRARTDQGTKPSMSMEGFVKQVADKKIIQMTIGADDYLADSLQTEFADAVVNSFSDLSGVISNWQQEAIQLQSEVRKTEKKIASRMEPANEEKVQKTKKEKFCMYCGAKLPIMANFCSSCGEEQSGMDA